MRDRHEIIYIILLLFVALIIRCYQITLPFIDDLATDAASMGHVARNLLRYGCLETNFGVVTNSGPVIDGNYVYAIDHPHFLFTFILSIFYRVFGIHEWSARLVPILFSMANLVMIYVLANKLWDKRTALFSLFFMSLMPMTAFYVARDIWPYCIGIFLSMLVICFYVSWIKEYQLKYYYGAVFSYTISLFFLWDIYFLGPVLIVYHILTKSRKVKLALLFPMLNFIVFALILVHIYFLQSGFDQLWKLFLLRTGSVPDDAVYHSFFGFLSLESYRAIKYFTVIVCLLSIAGIWNEIRNYQNKDHRRRLLLILFSWGALYSLLFWQGAMHQVNWICTLSPFFALSGARGLVFLQESVLPKVPCKGYVRLFLQLLSFIALMGCFLLAFHRSEQPEIGRYSWFFLTGYMIYICFTAVLLFFTWRMSKTSLRETSYQVCPVTLLLLFIFLAQSLIVINTLHQIRGGKIGYSLGNAIRENSQFEDAFITSITTEHLEYYLPYYADRYVVRNIRTMDDYLNILKKENRPFKYYITTNRELIKTKYIKSNDVSESANEWLNSYGITKEPCELNIYMSQHFMSEIVGPWIIYDLTSSKISF